MIASHLNPLSAALKAGSRVALVLATVALSWGPLAGVAEAKGWGAHQPQAAAPMHARPVLSGPVMTHPTMSPHLGLGSSLRRAAVTGSVHGMTTLRFISSTGAPRESFLAARSRVTAAHLGGIGSPREPRRTHPSAHFAAQRGTTTFGRVGARPLSAGTPGRNASLARVVREERIPTLEALRRAPLRR
jgi:hypothetical protein